MITTIEEYISVLKRNSLVATAPPDGTPSPTLRST